MKLLLVVFTLLFLHAGWAAATPSALQGLAFKGQVLEVKDVDDYSYLRLKTQDGEIWAAVNRAPVRKGAEVTIENAMVMNNFRSKSLNRTFDRIVFGSLGGAGSAAAPAVVPEAGDARIAKAQGPDARTVAEIIGRKAELKDKAVAVRGKVVKFTANVMGKNWVHLRDGSGSAQDRTNDILVTTKDPAQLGNVVVARGVVRTDVDLGSGYAYQVLIDDAKLQK
ncbi:MAG: nucleotide-binding protein [Betaproteobacteria bacterium RIFCSPLOWO2_02_FULL_67_19]|nr:MAG: nucleotide-binding protein [Betaproteobacteria bacterium RIFCSPLOWO2_02_FULL_67_19]